MKALIVPVTPFQQNCSIVCDEGTKMAAVVDPGGDLKGVPIEGPHPDDQFLIDDLPRQARQYGFAASSSFDPLDPRKPLPVGTGCDIRARPRPYVDIWQRAAADPFVADRLFEGAQRT